MEIGDKEVCMSIGKAKSGRCECGWHELTGCCNQDLETAGTVQKIKP